MIDSHGSSKFVLPTTSFFPPDDDRQVVHKSKTSKPDWSDFYLKILQNKLDDIDDIIYRIQDSKSLTKEIVEKLRQKRDDEPGKSYYTNFNALVNMLYEESKDDASKRSILESVGLLDDFKDDGPLLKGGRRRRKCSKRRKCSRRKCSRRRRSSRRK